MGVVVDESIVFAAADAILEDGTVPTARLIHGRLGGGDLGAVQRHLRDWRGVRQGHSLIVDRDERLDAIAEALVEIRRATAASCICAADVKAIVGEAARAMRAPDPAALTAALEPIAQLAHRAALAAEASADETVAREALRASGDERRDAVVEAIEKLSAQLSSMHERVETLIDVRAEEEIAALAVRFDHHTASISDQMAAIAAAVADAFGALNTRIDGLEQGGASAQDLADLRAALTDLSAQPVTIDQASLSPLEKTLAASQAQRADFKEAVAQRFAVLDDRLDGVDAMRLELRSLSASFREAAALNAAQGDEALAKLAAIAAQHAAIGATIADLAGAKDPASKIAATIADADGAAADRDAALQEAVRDGASRTAATLGDLDARMKGFAERLNHLDVLADGVGALREAVSGRSETVHAAAAVADVTERMERMMRRFAEQEESRSRTLHALSDALAAGPPAIPSSMRSSARWADLSTPPLIASARLKRGSPRPWRARPILSI